MNDETQKPIESQSEISDTDLANQLRDVEIPGTLQSRLLSVNQGVHKDASHPAESLKPQFQKRWLVWVVAASVLVGGSLITWLLMHQPNHDPGFAGGSGDGSGDGSGEQERPGPSGRKNEDSELDKKNKQQAAELANESLDEINRLEQLVAAQWKPGTDYSTTSEKWRGRHSRNRSSAMPITTTVRVGSEDDIPSILYHSALLTEQRSGGAADVRAEYQMVIDRFPDSVYASMSKRQLQRNQ